MSHATRIRPIAEPIISARGFSTYDIEQQGPILRVTVSAAESGQAPNMDDISAITREISRALDEDDPIDARYTLEVSSPGLERPLRLPEHFVGAVGEKVSIKLRRSDSGARRIRGLLQSVADDHICLVLDDAEEHTEVAYEEIDKARTVFEWGPTTRPGGKASAKKARTRRSKP